MSLRTLNYFNMKRRNRRYYGNFNKKNNLRLKSDINEDIYEIPNKIVIPPTTCTSSKKNKKAENEHKISESAINNKFNIKNVIDTIFKEEFIIIALIIILIYERMNLKNNNCDKETLSDYDFMIAALIYIYF